MIANPCVVGFSYFSFFVYVVGSVVTGFMAGLAGLIALGFGDRARRSVLRWVR
jgi:hypothetical protein